MLMTSFVLGCQLTSLQSRTLDNAGARLIGTIELLRMILLALPVKGLLFS